MSKSWVLNPRPVDPVIWIQTHSIDTSSELEFILLDKFLSRTGIKTQQPQVFLDFPFRTDKEEIEAKIFFSSEKEKNRSTQPESYPANQSRHLNPVTSSLSGLSVWRRQKGDWSKRFSHPKKEKTVLHQIGIKPSSSQPASNPAHQSRDTNLALLCLTGLKVSRGQEELKRWKRFWKTSCLGTEQKNLPNSFTLVGCRRINEPLWSVIHQNVPKLRVSDLGWNLLDQKVVSSHHRDLYGSHWSVQLSLA